MFWGIGKAGQGRNELGKALMRLRGRLRECARCSPKLQSPSVPIKPPEPAPDANVGMHPAICCTDGVLMSPTISYPAIAFLTLASTIVDRTPAIGCKQAICTACMYNTTTNSSCMHSSLRMYLFLYSKCKVGSLAVLVADRSGTPTPSEQFSLLGHLSLNPLNLHSRLRSLHPRF